MNEKILNNFKSKLDNHDFVYGTFVKSADPMFIEIAGIAGFDYVILDTEHGPTDIEHQQNNIRVCEARGICPIVRIPTIDENTIGKALDIGAYGIQVPQVKCVDDVKRITEYAKFYPQGLRGVCRFVRAADYSAKSKNEYFAHANKSLIILQLEGQEALDNLDEILNVDGYDILFIGPYDLSQSLGVPGDIKNPVVLSAMISIVEKAKEKGKVVGTFTDDYSMVEKWKSLGVQYIAHSTDSGLFYDKLREVYNKLNICGTTHSIARVLDCTLRDGGYVNSWKFGLKNTKAIIQSLIESNVDFIECGFVTDKEEHITGVTKFNSIEEVNKLLPKKSNKDFAVMINYDSYDIKNLPNYVGYGVNCIRVAFHKKDMNEALEFCKGIKQKGYNVFVQAMVTLNYSDLEFAYLIKRCNEFKPYAVYVVDSFGVMNRKELLHYYQMLERDLDNDIYPGFHAHNNMNLAFSNAITLLENANRNFIIDSSIHGMGRGAGNLNTEILIEYLNDNYLGDYKLKPILEANDLVLERIYSSTPWGYSLPNYLSAKHNCHPNYAKFLNEKQNLTVDDMNAIFDMLQVDKKVEFDPDYIDSLYTSYLESKQYPVDDINNVKKLFENKKIIMVCPGKTSVSKREELKKHIDDESIIVSINFNYDLEDVDYIFVGNNKRMNELTLEDHKKIICTSNIPANDVFAKISYSLLKNNTDGVSDNTGLMFLKLLTLCNVKSVVIIGMDGYVYNPADNYLNDELVISSNKYSIDRMNLGIKIEMQKFNEILNITDIK